MIMDEKDLPLQDKILLILHNLCVVQPSFAKTGEEISKIIHLSIDHVLKILTFHEQQGYIESFTDKIGLKRFYLSGIGIIKVCSSFT